MPTDARSPLARDAALDRARLMVAAEVQALGLPEPRFRLVRLAQARVIGPAVVDRVAVAEVQGHRRFTVVLPLAGDAVLPAELVARLPVPAPTSALYTRAGWTVHPELGQDPPAQALREALSQLHGMGAELQWSRRLPQGMLTLPWTIQLVADAADACALVVRTAPLGPAEDQVGVASFLAKLDAVGGLLRAWTGDVGLPPGPLDPCLALEPALLGEEVGPAELQPHRTAIPAPEPDEATEEAAGIAAVVDPERVRDTAAEVLEPPPAAAPPAAAPAAAAPPAAAPAAAAPAAAAPAGAITGPRASPLLAAVASLLVPGLGQALCGQVGKGLALLVLALFTCGLGGLLNLVAAADAWTVAGKLQRGGAVGRWSFFG